MCDGCFGDYFLIILAYNTCARRAQSGGGGGGDGCVLTRYSTMGTGGGAAAAATVKSVFSGSLLLCLSSSCTVVDTKIPLLAAFVAWAGHLIGRRYTFFGCCPYGRPCHMHPPRDGTVR